MNLNNIDLQKCDLHMHTCYSDGKNTPSEMLKSAIEKGMIIVGISDHSYTFFDESYCISKGRAGEYLQVLRSLQEKCLSVKSNSRIQKALGVSDISFLAGIEQDYYSTLDTKEYDYVIGSVHYIRVLTNGRKVPEGCLSYMEHTYIPVDDNKKILIDAARNFYDGDIYSLIEDYFLIESDVVNHTKCDIIGHFDLISKFNEDHGLFDPHNLRYIAAYTAALDTLLKTDAVFEINTGAISRGYRTSAYPSAEMIDYIKDHGGRFIFSSDAHNADNIGFGFSELL